MLRPDPKQVGRLTEIIENLEARLVEAQDRGWLGEVEGLEASLGAAFQKLTSMHRAAAPTGDTGESSVPVTIRAGAPPKPRTGSG